jgi:hypothetical protein
MGGQERVLGRLHIHYEHCPNNQRHMKFIETIKACLSNNASNS